MQLAEEVLRVSSREGDFWLLHVGIVARGQRRGLCFVNELFDTSYLSGMRAPPKECNTEHL